MTITFNGFNVHPGYAKGRMVSALKLAAAFIQRLPADGMSPETTADNEGLRAPAPPEGRGGTVNREGVVARFHHGKDLPRRRAC